MNWKDRDKRIKSATVTNGPVYCHTKITVVTLRSFD